MAAPPHFHQFRHLRGNSNVQYFFKQQTHVNEWSYFAYSKRSGAKSSGSAMEAGPEKLALGESHGRAERNQLEHGELKGRPNLKKGCAGGIPEEF